jgi:hypothetical protein
MSKCTAVALLVLLEGSVVWGQDLLEPPRKPD